MKKYLLSILILLLCFPVMVNAANEAKIGETEYATIEAAITAATDNATITLLGDNDDIVVTNGKNITIDLGGFKITSMENAGTLTLKNGDIIYDLLDRAITNTGIMVVDGVDLDGNDSAAFTVINNGTITFKNSTFSVTEGNYTGFLNNGANATATIESGTYVSDDLFDNKGTMIINGGTWTMTYNNTTNTNSGTLTINNGTFIAEENNFIDNIRGHLIVNGGTFTGLDGVMNYDPSYVNNTGSESVIDINGGTFNVTGMAFGNTTFSAYSIINFNNGTVNSTTTEYVVGDYGSGNSNKINIYGGTITANNAKGIFLQGGNILTIGKDDGTVNANIPLIDIRKGYIHTLGETTINFYDGVLNIVKDGLYDGTITTIKTPTKYSVKYDKNEDNSYKAYLEKEVDKYWEKFVEAYKNSEIVQAMIEISKDHGSSIVHTDDSLTITMPITSNGGVVTTHVIRFTYDSETGIVKYVPVEEVTIDNAVLLINDDVLIYNTLIALSDIKGYDVEKVAEWMETLKNPTIEKDGITFKYGEFSYQDETSSLETEYFTDYQLDIVNGLKSFDNTSKPVTNPSTGISFPIIFVLIIVVFGCGVYLIRNKKYFSRG